MNVIANLFRRVARLFRRRGPSWKSIEVRINGETFHGVESISYDEASQQSAVAQRLTSPAVGRTKGRLS
jgi:hypothetical protein